MNSQSNTKKEITLYHGTSYHNLEKIMNEGLKGGDNTKGGTHGRWTKPALFLAAREHVAEKYGEVITITIPEEMLEKLGGQRINDGLGDECIIIESEKFDEIIIDLDFLSCKAYDHELGMCDEDCAFCKE